MRWMWESDALVALGIILGLGALVAFYFSSSWAALTLDLIVGLIGLVCFITGWALGKLDEKLEEKEKSKEQ